MYKIAVLIVSIIIINLIEKNLIKFKYYKEKEFDREFLKYGFISIGDLKKLDEYEFCDWLISLVNEMGYVLLKEYSDKSKIERRFIYEKNAAIGLLRMLHKDSTDEMLKVDVDELEKEIGFMVSQNLKEGIFITSGEFTNEAKEYINTLSNKFKISLVDGYYICNKKRQLWY